MVSKNENPEDRTVIFLHVPKTAGTTLIRVMEQQYRPEDVYSVVEPRDFQDLAALSETRKAEFRLLVGHMDFGAHELLPGSSTYFTLLRHPIERVISHYYFMLQEPQYQYYDIITSSHMNLKKFIESEIDIMMDNVQTRMLSGKGAQLAFGTCTEEVLETAKKNLREHFTVVGLTERFDETLLLLKRAFGWQNSFYLKRNVTTSRLKRDELPAATLDTIINANQLDMELYRYATALFKEQVHRQGPLFPARVKLFQSANKLLTPFTKIYREIRKRSIRTFARKWIDTS